MTVALMWEARAAEGRAAELLAWVREQRLDGERAPLRRETFAASGERVLVITWWDAPLDAAVPELPDPRPELAARPVHRWRFESLGVS
ncbi:hypothetical protein [Streptomyces albus]|uniref:hypothetical protein n=1 Tax=Streptomyces albus TaxID=1888 RepID=UPI0004C98B16|nr:hypothetical protein [Streptomyces albus]